MKLRHLLFGLLAGVAFVACTNDNEPAGVTPADGNKVTTGDKYITVDLQFPGSGAATRAIDGQGFLAATEAENAVSEAAFLFFKADGTQAAEPFVIKAGDKDANGDAWDPNKDGTTPFANKYPVVVIKDPTAIPTSMVVLINSGKTEEDLADATVESLQADIANYGQTGSGKFVMSNSVYVAGDDVVIGAPVGAENIRESADAAKTAPAPVKVYVERVVAKVVVNDKTKSTADAINSGVQGVNVSLQGWGFAYQNTTSSLIKKLSSNYSFEDTDNPKNTATWANWNDATNHRSYWANSAPWDKVADNTTWEGAKNKLDGTTAYYTQEHIEKPQKTIEQKGFPTAIVVSAALTETVDGEEVPVLLYKHKGVLYREDGFKQFMINGQSIQNVYFKADPTAETDQQTGQLLKLVSLEPGDFTVKIDNTATGLESYESKVYLSLNEGVVVYNSDREVVTDAAKTAIANVKEIVQFWNGASYYYVPIVQNDALNLSVKKVIPAETEGGEATKVYWGLFGVVRNHIYQVNINKVQGLGTPVANPKEIIYPETPKDEDYYIAAKINILEWKKVTQEVNLGE